MQLRWCRGFLASDAWGLLLHASVDISALASRQIDHYAGKPVRIAEALVMNAAAESERTGWRLERQFPA